MNNKSKKLLNSFVKIPKYNMRKTLQSSIESHLLTGPTKTIFHWQNVLKIQFKKEMDGVDYISYSIFQLGQIMTYL